MNVNPTNLIKTVSWRTFLHAFLMAGALTIYLYGSRFFQIIGMSNMGLFFLIVVPILGVMTVFLDGVKRRVEQQTGRDWREILQERRLRLIIAAASFSVLITLLDIFLDGVNQYRSWLLTVGEIGGIVFFMGIGTSRLRKLALTDWLIMGTGLTLLFGAAVVHWLG